MKWNKPQKPGPVLRVRVQQQKGKWKIIKRIHVKEMTIPGSVELPKPNRYGRLAGFWCEAVDAGGNVLYRQLLREPPRGIEVFGEDGSISRIDAEIDRYTVDLLMPDIPEIQDLLLFLEGPDRASAEKSGTLQPVAVFSARGKDAPEQSKKKGGKHHGNE